MTEEQRQEIARQIAEGNTSGRVDETDEEGYTHYMAWELQISEWEG